MRVFVKSLSGEAMRCECLSSHYVEARRRGGRLEAILLDKKFRLKREAGPYRFFWLHTFLNTARGTKQLYHIFHQPERFLEFERKELERRLQWKQTTLRCHFLLFARTLLMFWISWIG